MNEIMLKSLFYGWKPVTYETALDWAKWHITATTTARNDEHALEMTNSRLRGVQFSLCELKGQP